MVAVLTSDSVTDAADRLEFASAVAQQDADLTTEVSVQTQELAWQREQLTEAIQEQERAKADLANQEASINAQLDDYEARVSELEDQLAAEQAPPPTTGRGGGTTGGGDGSGVAAPAVAAVAGADHRERLAPDLPGGRTQLLRRFLRRPAPRRPLPRGDRHDRGVRTRPSWRCTRGTVHRTGSSIGGYGIVLFHDGSADWTFYTHFDHYGAYGEGGARDARAR